MFIPESTIFEARRALMGKPADPGINRSPRVLASTMHAHAHTHTHAPIVQSPRRVIAGPGTDAPLPGGHQAAGGAPKTAADLRRMFPKAVATIERDARKKPAPRVAPPPVGNVTAADLRRRYPKAVATIERAARVKRKTSAMTTAPTSPRAGAPRTYRHAAEQLAESGVPRGQLHQEILGRWPALAARYGADLARAWQTLRDAEARHKTEATPESARAMGRARAVANAVALGDPLEQ